MKYNKLFEMSRVLDLSVLSDDNCLILYGIELSHINMNLSEIKEKYRYLFLYKILIEQNKKNKNI